MQPHAFHGFQRLIGAEVPGYVGKLPKPCQQPPVWTLFQCVGPVAAEDEHGPVLLPPLFLGGFYRQLLRSAPLVPQADAAAGTVFAIRLPVRAAYRGPQLHQCLGEIPGLRGIDFFQQCRDPLLCFRQVDGAVVVRQPGHHPQHIPVHCWGWLGKSDGADGTGGVSTDSGQSDDFVVRSGENPVILVHNHLGRLLQVPHPAVIAQTFPQLVQHVIVTHGQRRNVRQNREKAGIIALHGFHPGLLKHNFRQPDVVRLPVLPPGKHTPVLPVPGQKQPGESIKIRMHRRPSIIDAILQ